MSHNLLLHKLHHNGIQSKTHRWITDFLNKRNIRQSKVGIRITSRNIPRTQSLNFFFTQSNGLPEARSTLNSETVDDTYLTIFTRTDTNSKKTWTNWQNEKYFGKSSSTLNNARDDFAMFTVTRKKEKSNQVGLQTPRSYTRAWNINKTPRRHHCKISRFGIYTHKQHHRKSQQKPLVSYTETFTSAKNPPKSMPINIWVRPQMEYATTVWDQY